MKVCLASFDPVPAPKGASAHILRNHRILTDAGHEVSLVSLGDRTLAGLRHRPMRPDGSDWLQRGRSFREQCARVFRVSKPDIVHVRSPFEGLAVSPDTRLVYEVNALYSIEVPCRYPQLAGLPSFRERMRAAELLVLQRADAIITPSTVTARYLGDLGLPDVTVVPNCPSIPVVPALAAPRRGGPARLVYIGTLAPWQGLHQAIHCLGRLGSLDWTLDIHTPTRRTKWVSRMIRKIEMDDRIRVLPAVHPSKLGALLRTFDIGLAPLTPGERNLVQGAMPVKLLDYARAGLDIIAPDIEIVTSMLPADQQLYRAWSRTDMTERLADAITRVGDYDAARARAHVDGRFGERVQARALMAVYSSL